MAWASQWLIIHFLLLIPLYKVWSKSKKINEHLVFQRSWCVCVCVFTCVYTFIHLSIYVYRCACMFSDRHMKLLKANTANEKKTPNNSLSFLLWPRLQGPVWVEQNLDTCLITLQCWKETASPWGQFWCCGSVALMRKIQPHRCP